MPWLDWTVRVMSWGGGAGALLLGLIYAFQEKLLYVPRIPGMPDFDDRLVPGQWGFEEEDVWLTAADGTKLHAWLLVPRGWDKEVLRSRPVLLFFQENAGNMSHRLPFLRVLAQQLQCSIFAPSYRGYGMSEGRPNQRGLQLDAQAALEHLLGRDDVPRSSIVVFGRSLGGAVAIHLAAENQDKIKALIVENTFMSVEDMVSQVLPPLGAVIGTGKPLNCLVTNKWRNLAEIERITQLPLLLMASVHDEMVPFRQMQRLHQAVRTQRCTWVEFPNSRHMDAYESNRELYWPALRGFMQQYVH
ncbi:hypothetical protein OEZ85_004325 [Tetradesmus obliquus]|uniref:AB hydrolase-1 domain-containing protein n=1 Tax=Tetradesmus obliquus TaxID=3088 RepID=A0ABY8ULS4_TETOB|nr:hypothetical protein OEZ85_004325 [Tetradesmus obliquus]